MILLPETTGFVLASRIGTAGNMRKTPVLGPVSVAIKDSVSPVSEDLSVIGLLSMTVGSWLQAAAFTCIHRGELMGVTWMVLPKVLSK